MAFGSSAAGRAESTLAGITDAYWPIARNAATVLLETREQYIDWQEFYLWVRSILEVGATIPDWLVEILNARCLGLVSRKSKNADAEGRKEEPLHFRLEDWIDEHVLAFAEEEGWFNAITYYAIRDHDTSDPKSAGRNASTNGRR